MPGLRDGLVCLSRDDFTVFAPFVLALQTLMNMSICMHPFCMSQIQVFVDADVCVRVLDVCVRVCFWAGGVRVNGMYL